MWTGDDSGSMEYVRWQLPTFVGTGFSAMAHVSGDIDGIFGGSPESYVRDLQFKCLMTTIMTMSGWAANPDKQPWTWGEPFLTYNRASLKFKSQLTPYMYSASREAYDTGVPPVRAMLLEFPQDEALYVPSNGTNYQFMSGASLLVAPVFEQGAVTRDNIYLPAGTQWSDYSTGDLYEGGQTLNAYPAPLDKLPLFVREGAILPLWTPTNFFNESLRDTMLLELWPSGNSSFTLYEDDGVTRAALPPTNAFATTLISVSAPSTYLNASGSGNVTITVAPSAGSFDGQLASRGWFIEVRSRSSPLSVVVVSGADGTPVELPAAQSEAELSYLPAGFFFNPALQRGLLQVKLSAMAAADGFVVTLSNGPSYSHIGTETCDTPLHRQVEEQRFAFDAAKGTFTVGNASSSCLTIGADKDPDSHTPALEVQDCSTDLADRQSFTLLASGQLAFKSDATTCLDQDVSDFRVIAYGCHDPSSPGNQGWKIDATTQHVISAANGLCMAVFPSS
jgi:alpha-glucosidase